MSELTFALVDRDRLQAEVDRLRAEIVMLVKVGETVLESLVEARSDRDSALAGAVPDGHVRLDGDLYRVEAEDLGDPFGNKAYLFEVET